jgi:hypothetical protein
MDVRIFYFSKSAYLTSRLVRDGGAFFDSPPYCWGVSPLLITPLKANPFNGITEFFYDSGR